MAEALSKLMKGRVLRASIRRDPRPASINR
jgi:hypothetical protein